MSLENIKSSLYLSIEELFVTAAMDEMTGDTAAYREKLNTIARVAAVLGIKTEITEISINLADEKSDRE